MVDTQKSVAELLAAMPTGVPEAISAQDIRNVVVSAMGVYGTLWVPAGSAAAQLIAVSTQTPLTLWTQGESDGVTADAVAGTLTIIVPGEYSIVYGGSWSSTATNFDLVSRITRNGNDTDIGAFRPVGNTPFGVGSVIGPSIDLLAGDVLRLTVETTKATTISAWQATFRANLIGPS